jgi:hypothetical protein
MNQILRTEILAGGEVGGECISNALGAKLKLFTVIIAGITGSTWMTCNVWFGARSDVLFSTG